MTYSGTLNHLLYLVERYVVLIFCAFFFFFFNSSIQIKLRRADGRATERWILSSARPDSESAQGDYDEQWELLQRIGRFLRQFWGSFVWSFRVLARYVDNIFVFCDYRESSSLLLKLCTTNTLMSLYIL